MGRKKRRGEPPPRQISVARRIKRRVPKSSVVTITVTGDDVSYADIMRRARAGIVLEDIVPQGGAGLRLRRAQTGGLLIEIPGAESRPVAE